MDHCLPSHDLKWNLQPSTTLPFWYRKALGKDITFREHILRMGAFEKIKWKRIHRLRAYLEVENCVLLKHRPGSMLPCAGGLQTVVSHEKTGKPQLNQLYLP